MRDDVAPLSQILERIERIKASGIDRDRFLKHPWDQDALIRNLEIIGEAAKRLSNATRDRAQGIRWSDIAGFRDIAIHGYDKLSLEKTWVIVERDLPLLTKEVRRLLSTPAGRKSR
ncbi:MAG: HepT-like ribonuclease domain-containing protein [Thermoplasmata archaeon]